MPSQKVETMNHTNIKYLLDLSRKHLILTNNENWNQWELVAGQKEDLYKKIISLRGRSIDENEKKMLAEIKTLEARIIEQIDKKRNKIKKELDHVKNSKIAIKYYHKADKKDIRPHFNFKC